jgi:hypothetical protein
MLAAEPADGIHNLTQDVFPAPLELGGHAHHLEWFPAVFHSRDSHVGAAEVYADGKRRHGLCLPIHFVAAGTAKPPKR